MDEYVRAVREQGGLKCRAGREWPTVAVLSRPANARPMFRTGRAGRHNTKTFSASHYCPRQMEGVTLGMN